MLPDIIENMIFIGSELNRGKKGFNEYRRYLTEVKVNGNNYVILSIVGKNQEGFYYDQQLFYASKVDFVKKIGSLAWVSL